MANYNIKDLENLSGIKAHTIRIWEKRYQIVSPGRTDTNIRTYDDEDLRRLLNISILNNHGMKISHLAQLTEKEIQEKVLFVSQNPTDFHAQIESIILSMLNLDEAHFHQVFNKSVMTNGFERTFEDIILKTLDRIGVLWLAGTINPAQEHFISNLIRQKLISNIDSLPVSRNPNPKRFLLFLPEGEQHELGLLYASYLIKKRGHEVLYFGQQTPINSVNATEKLWKTDYIVISVVAPMTDLASDDFSIQINDCFRGKTVLLAGKYAMKFDTSKCANIHKFNEISEFTAYLNGV